MEGKPLMQHLKDICSFATVATFIVAVSQWSATAAMILEFGRIVR
jgi:hypothetical protein